jgi:hypothetical protein
LWFFPGFDTVTREFMMTNWRCALELDSRRNPVAGSAEDLARAIGRGADLRVYTEFRHNEHIDVNSSSAEQIKEVAEFGVTCLINRTWTAGIMSLRQPIELPVGFGPRASMSFFLYNQDGTQAIARPYLDGVSAEMTAVVTSPEKMPRYHTFDSHDASTKAPSQNFVYDFDIYRFHVDDSWQEVFRHSATGDVLSGSITELVDAFSSGASIKLGIEDVCRELVPEPQVPLVHEVFVQGGSAYYYAEQKLFVMGSHPLVRVAPNIPLRYASGNWDFGWLMARSDGHVVYRRCDPYSLAFSDHVVRKAVRWFVR